MDDWMEDLQKEEQKQKKIKALGETVRVSRIDPRNGWNSAPPFEVTQTLQSKGYKHEPVEVPIGNVGPADVVITTAIIAGGAGVISAAISASVAYISKIKEANIELKGKGGQGFVIPASTSKEDIDFYVQKAKELDADEITIIDKPTHGP